jgi:hypothetical protein
VVLGEICAHVTCGTVTIVGGSGYQNGNACGTVALVSNLLVGFTGGAQCLLDATLDVIVGNVVGFCLLNQVAELRVGGGVAAACLYRYGDLLPILVKILPLAASVFSFLCLIFAHLLCPDISEIPF